MRISDWSSDVCSSDLGAGMRNSESGEKTIGVTAFKSRCLALIDEIAQGKTSRVLLMKRNKPVDAMVALEAEPFELWGAMKGRSEERRVGKGGVSTCRSRWSP